MRFHGFSYIFIFCFVGCFPTTTLATSWEVSTTTTEVATIWEISTTTIPTKCCDNITTKNDSELSTAKVTITATSATTTTTPTTSTSTNTTTPTTSTSTTTTTPTTSTSTTTTTPFTTTTATTKTTSTTTTASTTTTTTTTTHSASTTTTTTTTTDSASTTTTTTTTTTSATTTTTTSTTKKSTTIIFMQLNTLDINTSIDVTTFFNKPNTTSTKTATTTTTSTTITIKIPTATKLHFTLEATLKRFKRANTNLPNITSNNVPNYLNTNLTPKSNLNKTSLIDPNITPTNNSPNNTNPTIKTTNTTTNTTTNNTTTIHPTTTLTTTTNTTTTHRTTNITTNHPHPNPNWNLLTIITKIVATIIFTTIIIATIFGNIMVITAVVTERSLRIVANYLIASLAFVDLMVACLVMPVMAIKEMVGRWVMGAIMCDAWITMDVLLCTSSILHLLSIAVDRYWAVTRERYIYERPVRPIIMMIFLSWFVSGLLCATASYTWWADYKEEIDMRGGIGGGVMAGCNNTYLKCNNLSLDENFQNKNHTSLRPLHQTPHYSPYNKQLPHKSPVSLVQQQQEVISVYDPDKTGECKMSQDLDFTVYSTVAAFYIPLLVIIIIYIKIFKVARKRIRKRTFKSSRSATEPANHANGAQSHSKRVRENKAAVGEVCVAAGNVDGGRNEGSNKGGGMEGGENHALTIIHRNDGLMGDTNTTSRAVISESKNDAKDNRRKKCEDDDTPTGNITKKRFLMDGLGGCWKGNRNEDVAIRKNKVLGSDAFANTATKDTSLQVEYNSDIKMADANLINSKIGKEFLFKKQKNYDVSSETAVSDKNSKENCRPVKCELDDDLKIEQDFRDVRVKGMTKLPSELSHFTIQLTASNTATTDLMSGDVSPFHQNGDFGGNDGDVGFGVDGNDGDGDGNGGGKSGVDCAGDGNDGGDDGGEKCEEGGDDNSRRSDNNWNDESGDEGENGVKNCEILKNDEKGVKKTKNNQKVYKKKENQDEVERHKNKFEDILKKEETNWEGEESIENLEVDRLSVDERIKIKTVPNVSLKKIWKKNENEVNGKDEGCLVGDGKDGDGGDGDCENGGDGGSGDGKDDSKNAKDNDDDKNTNDIKDIIMIKKQPESNQNSKHLKTTASNNDFSSRSLPISPGSPLATENKKIKTENEKRKLSTVLKQRKNFFKIRKSSRQRLPQEESLLNQSLDSSSGPFRSSRRHERQPTQEKRAQTKERKAARTLAIITGTFMMCWLPFFIVALVMPFCASRCHMPPLIESGITWMGYLNSGINPIIYTVFNADFRNAFKRILHRAIRSRHMCC